jgi:hypothetical protein
VCRDGRVKEGKKIIEFFTKLKPLAVIHLEDIEKLAKWS